MSRRISRRTFVALAGGSAVAAAAVVWKTRGDGPSGLVPGPPREALVDESGWIVTSEEQEKLPREELAVETR